MMIIAIVVGCIAGVGLGFLIPTIPYTASQYLAIAIVADYVRYSIWRDCIKY